jgi:hypothetical protein
MTLNQGRIADGQKSQMDALREDIKRSLEKAQVQRSAVKCQNYNYAMTNIVFSSIAAFLAGAAGLLGNQGGFWKESCLLAAAFSTTAAVAAKVQKPDELAEASEYVGKLKALKVETSVPNRDWQEVSERYQQILSECVSIDY